MAYPSSPTATGAPTGTTTGDVGGSGDGKTEEAKAKAQQVAGQAKEQAQQGAEQAKGMLRTQVDQRSTQAGEQISSQASDVRSLADELRTQGKDGPAKIAEQAADRAERVGGYLSNSDADTILSDVEDFARRNPWAVMAGGIAAGFLASRFVKASTDRRSSSSVGRSSTPQLPPAGGTRPTPGYGNGMGTVQTPPTTPTAPPTAPPAAPPTTGTGGTGTTGFGPGTPPGGTLPGGGTGTPGGPAGGF